MTEYAFQCLIQIFIVCSLCSDVAEQFTWQYEKAFFFHQTVPCFFGFVIWHCCKIKIGISGFDFTVIDVAAQVLGNIAIEHCAEDIVLKIPSVYCTTQFIRYCPDCTMEFITLLFLFSINHFLFLRLRLE